MRLLATLIAVLSLAGAPLAAGLCVVECEAPAAAIVAHHHGGAIVHGHHAPTAADPVAIDGHDCSHDSAAGIAAPKPTRLQTLLVATAHPVCASPGEEGLARYRVAQPGVTAFRPPAPPILRI